MNAATPEAPSVAARLKQVTDYVMDCERRVMRGEIMELQGLDDTVMEICNDVAALSQDEAQALEQNMTKLIDGLERLADAIRVQEEQSGA